MMQLALLKDYMRKRWLLNMFKSQYRGRCIKRGKSLIRGKMYHTRGRKKMEKIDLMYSMFGKGDGKCKYCSHFREHCYSRKYFKCDVYGETASEATDWRANYSACGLFNKFTSYKNVYELAKEEKRDIPEEQMSLF